MRANSAENLVLSPEDIQVAGQVYSRDTQVARQNVAVQQKALADLSKVPDLPSALKAYYISDLQNLQSVTRH